MQATETVSQGRSGGTSCVPRCPLRPHLQNTNSDRITKNFRTATTERGPLRAGRRVTARESGPRSQLRCHTPPPPRDTCLTGRLAVPHTVLSHPRPDGRYDHIRDASEKLVLSLLGERAPHPLCLNCAPHVSQACPSASGHRTHVGRDSSACPQRECRTRMRQQPQVLGRGVLGPPPPVTRQGLASSVHDEL